MTLNLHLNGRVWTVTCGTKAVAELRLDYYEQIEAVVLSSDAPDSVQLSVLQLAVFHVHNFAKERHVPYVCGISPFEKVKRKLTSVDSRLMMDFNIIPKEAKQLSYQTAVQMLQRIAVGVTVTVFETVDAAMLSVLAEVGNPTLRYKMVRCREDEIILRFSVAKPHSFTFWKSESVPRSNDELRVVPFFHPVMSGGKSVGLVNGSTDAYISGKTIRSIFSPKAARSIRAEGGLGASWRDMKNPFFAVGRSVCVRLDATSLRSREGVREMIEFLQAALGTGKHFVSISGGFSAPLRCGHNRLVELGIASPSSVASYGNRGPYVRGSEEHCVWAYWTLERAGLLDRSYVPAWFLKEGWLKVYEGAEVSPGLY